YDRARRELERSLQLEVQVRGNDDFVVANVLKELANLYTRIGDLERAETTYRRTLAIYLKVDGPDAQRTIDTQADLASCLLSRHRLDAADQLLSAVMEWDAKHGT